MSECGYEWEGSGTWDDHDHTCILGKDHDGEHECSCGESQPEELAKEKET